MPRLYTTVLSKKQTIRRSILLIRPKLCSLLPSRQFGINSTRKAPVSDKTKIAASESNQSLKLEKLFNVKDKGEQYINPSATTLF